MMQQSNEKPLKLHDLGDGRTHFNFNIEEGVSDEGDNMFTYNQVTIVNPVNKESVIVALIRRNYSLNSEIAVIRKKDVDPVAFQNYFDFVEQCKVIANE